MNRKTHAFVRVPLLRVAVVALILGVATVAFAQTYDLSWHTIDGGGGFSAGGSFELEGTIGQPDAGLLTGGDFELSGGFWAGAVAVGVNCACADVDGIPGLDPGDVTLFVADESPA